MATRSSAETARQRADRAVKACVVNEFGVGSQQALDFGFAPPRKATRTVESKVNAVALAKATRAARHTMGKKQKSLIKGTMVVPATPAVPANVPAGASPASLPATPAAPAAAPQPQMQMQMQMQMVNGVQAPAAAASANGASGH